MEVLGHVGASEQLRARCELVHAGGCEQALTNRYGQAAEERNIVRSAPQTSGGVGDRSLVRNATHARGACRQYRGWWQPPLLTAVRDGMLLSNWSASLAAE